MTLIERLRKRAEIRRSIPRSEPDRIADICEEAADEIGNLCGEIEKWKDGNIALLKTLARSRKWYDSEYPPEDGHDQVYPWD